MNQPSQPETFDQWFSELTRLATAADCQWLISSDPAYQRAAFAQGLAPAEELERLQALGAWNGCGCGA